MSKTLDYVLFQRKVKLGKNAGKTMQVARLTGRRKVGFRQFCEEVARGTSFSRPEIEAVINYATQIAKTFVSDGDMVEFGDLGTLVPSIKSKAVEEGETFNPQKHIEGAHVHLRPSKEYFTLRGMHYHQVQPKAKKKAEEEE